MQANLHPMVLELKNADIYQRDNLVLNSVNLRIEPGQFIYLIGATGSGKSSLLKTLYGDLPLTKGEGTVAGYDLKSIKEKDIPFALLHRLIEETARKGIANDPNSVQTGPAIRKDSKTIQNHLEYLEEGPFYEIYKLLTQSIQHVKEL